MNRITVLVLFLFFSSFPSFAQGWQWGRGSIGNNIASWPVATDTFGNVFAAGISAGPVSFDNNSPSFTSNAHQCVIAKYDAWGDFLWVRNTENGPNTFLINITTDLAGNCYLLGWMPDSTIEIGSFTLRNAIYPYAQYFIAKYNPAGDVIWAKNAGGRSGTLTSSPIALDSIDTVNMMGLGAITSDKKENIYVTTAFNLPIIVVGNDTLVNQDASGTTNDIMLAKYDSLGNVIWAKSSGGDKEDIPFSITTTPLGAIYIAGIFNSDSAVFGTSVIKDTCTAVQKWNGFIARYDASGNPVWASGSGGGGKVYASGITSGPSNNIYLTGGTNDSSISFGGATIINDSGKPVLYLVKFDTSNNVVWQKTIVSPNGGAAWGYAIAAAGNIVWVSGAFTKEISVDNKYLDTPAASIDPVFIASFYDYEISAYYMAGAALQSGSVEQSGLACDRWGDVYLCGDYKYPCAPFIIAYDVLPNVTLNEHWLYLAKYSGGGTGGGGAPQTIYDSLDITMCPYDSVSLIAPRGYAIYHWNNGSTDTTLTATTAGTYWVTGIGNTNTLVIDSFRVKTDIALCDCDVFIPSAFTPNRNGINDTYGPVFGNGCFVANYAFSIYNRWGQRVFYSEDPYAKWDGTYKGGDADMGVYMFYLKYTTNPNYPEHIKKGDVTLIR